MASNQSFACSVCSVTFSRKDNLERHKKKHEDSYYSCSVCDYRTNRPDNLKRHSITYHKKQDITTKSASVKQDRPGARQAHINVNNLIECSRKWIEDFEHITSRFQDRYNFEVQNPTPTKLKHFVTKIFLKQRYAFRINLSFGYVLFNNISGEHEYFYASTNNRLLPKPITISCAEDITRFVEAIDVEDIVEFCKSQRENSRYVVERITNVLFYVNKIKNVYIGCPDLTMPDYLLNKRSIITLVKHHSGQYYDDDLCLFRCIAYHCHGKKLFEQKTKEMAAVYCHTLQMNLRLFKGVTMEALHVVENLFKVNIVVYTLKEEKTINGSTFLAAQKVRESQRRYPVTVNVNVYKNHFSYIKNLSQYSNRWQCKKCSKLFRIRKDATRHERRCLHSTTFKYGNGGYGLPKTIFDLLLENNYRIDDNLKYYDYRIAFDFESMSERVPIREETKLKYVRRLIPASVSVCSNVPGYEQPRCFVSNGNSEELIAEMFGYMSKIQVKCYAILADRYKDDYRSLQIVTRLKVQQDRAQVLRAELADTSENSRKQELMDMIYRHNVFDQLTDQLDSWLRQIPVLGFNSSHFDLNLIRQHLFPFMLRSGMGVKHIIKKGSDYLSIVTADFKFLDIKQFLSPGVSYAGWLKVSDVSASKGFWPYEWFENLQQLEENKLVPQKCFWSKLKQEGISDEDYENLENVWKTEGFKTMKDLLIWYNNLDTAPFLEAAQKMHDLWRAQGMDAFKGNCISLPGLALQLLVKRLQAHTILPLLKESEVFNLVKANITGGLAVVMHRYHRARETFLPNGKPVARIYSHDANALYLWALGEETGTGIYGIWRPQTSEGLPSMAWRRSSDSTLVMKWHDVKRTNEEVLFHRQLSHRHMTSQLEWLEFTSHIKNIRIEHKFNGREKVVYVTSKVQYPVDGFDPESHTVYQFHGCYWHGHGCYMDTEKDAYRRYSNRRATCDIENKLKELGYNLCVIWECEWVEQKKRNPEIRAFSERHFQLAVKTNSLTAEEIVRLIQCDGMFGMVECDLEVPWWSQSLLSRFADFPPIYKNTDISIDDVGTLMKNYAEEHEMLRKPRRCLINSYWARKILLTTPLLKWYLRNGVVITKIYQVIEMKGKQCFADLRDEIADHRRRADQDPKLKPEGENWKLVGNSCYGKTVTNKSRHKETKIIPDDEVCSYINDRRFSKMEEAGDNAYEVCMDKRTIKQDLPITIGFFVYNAAKLRMLQFVYDFLKKYLREGSYQMVCSDTDSIIAAYEDSNLENLVKPEMSEEYHTEGKKKFLVVNDQDLRTPGLFKVELEATLIVALCSKTYFAFNEDDGSSKISSKGLSKKTNHFTAEDFAHVLLTKERGSGTNHGLRMKGQEMMQYQQERAGLSYLYIKRRVLSDGISTEPLDV